jgi:hypothetical protein
MAPCAADLTDLLEPLRALRLSMTVARAWVTFDRRPSMSPWTAGPWPRACPCRPRQDLADLDAVVVSTATVLTIPESSLPTSTWLWAPGFPWRSPTRRVSPLAPGSFTCSIVAPLESQAATARTSTQRRCPSDYLFRRFSPEECSSTPRYGDIGIRDRLDSIMTPCFSGSLF